MLNTKLFLTEDLFSSRKIMVSCREGFGEGLLQAAKEDENLVALCADLIESTRVNIMQKKFPNRVIQVGIAEQNMAGIAAGLALCGKVPFIVSHAGFSPSRNWDQIRLAVCISKTNVKVCGSHSGFSNGRDGAPDISLEDISLMRTLPNMTVINPIDSEETRKAVIAAAEFIGPVYIRFSKEDTPLITTKKTPFQIGKAQVLVEGRDVTIVATGPLTYEALVAAKELLGKHKLSAEVIAMSTIKPLDRDTILKSVKKTKKVVTVEEHQINGGLGSAVAELLSEEYPTQLVRIGVKDTFGESGGYNELLDKYGLSAHHIENAIVKRFKFGTSKNYD